ncbi:glycosyltransferase [Aliiglaciecola sp. 2_MG-2023]|uniref:glycosyltransferase n=1 Tax=unclassified Aliiglaciecola TaxID=2593648 RepID=UPI0026E485C6|nr:MULTISPECIES: glycosyltransferase [unclassified Aliiglaciecola]MDO6709190.1 glycosyltransferase [Aliiglaciecola sp. 2_MG-2023]MDO6750338.1 glycosyltransferase [Aliiglaciecola sp. 1_MG-2023]
MKKPIKISVVIPVYNCEALIEETLSSVLNQTYPVHQIILVNDGSTDHSLQVLQGYNADNIVIIDRPNGGVSSARNEGIMHATGDWVAFLDSDDIWMPNKLALYAEITDCYPESSVIYSEFLAWEPAENGLFSNPLVKVSTNNNIEIEPKLSGWIYHQQLLTNWVLTSTAMFKRSLFEQIGMFNTELTIAEDWDLFIRASRVAQFSKIKQPLTYYRITPDSLTKTVKQRDFANEIIQVAIKKYGLKSPDGTAVDIKQFNQRSFTRYFDYGLGAYRQTWYRKAVQAFWQALKYRPSAMRTWIYLAKAVLKLIITSPKK